MQQAIPHPAGLFSGRVAARLAAAGWASGVRRARPQLGKRALIALALGIQLGLVLLGAQLLRDADSMRHAQPAALPAPAPVWQPGDLGAPAPAPAQPRLSPEVYPDPPPPPAPAPESTPALPSAPEFTPPAPASPSGRVAEQTSVPKPAAVIVPIVSDDDRSPPSTLISVVATGYCPCTLCCGENADGHTAIMRDANKHRGIAVDPLLIPYRTMLTVPGYGTAMVDDTGEAMRRDGARGVVHIDLRFRTHAQAKAWGVRHLTVAVPIDSRAAAVGAPAPLVAEEATADAH